MIAKLRRWMTPFLNRLNKTISYNWKTQGYQLFPDHPYYFETLADYPDYIRPRRFPDNWERRT